MLLVGLGIRATPKEIFYSIIENSNGNLEIKITSKVIIPVSLSFPEKLNFIRKAFKDILFESRCSRAGIRVSEDISLNPSLERISYEAVIQELFASSSVEKYLIGKVSTMCPRLGIDRKDYRPLIDTKISFDMIENFEGYSSYYKETILVCLAAFSI